MLWAYLDDSGLRAKGGKNGPLVRYALGGGGVATADVWDALVSEWRTRLNDPSNPSKVDWFHYTDWKSAYLGHAKRGDQFYGWSQRQLLDLLTDLTKMISKKKVDYRMPVITKMMQLLKQEPPYHHMIELHLHDEKDE
jgi:hypothetical protein